MFAEKKDRKWIENLMHSHSYLCDFTKFLQKKSQYVVLRSDDSNFSFHEIFNDKEN